MIKFRLYCESCTGVARFGSEDDLKKTGEVICSSCMKRTPMKKENWIVLNDEEVERLNRPVNRVLGMKVIETKHKDK